MTDKGRVVIVVGSKFWGVSDLPEWLVSTIVAQREMEALLRLIAPKGRVWLASDEEVVAALYGSVMDSPVDSRGVRLYLYACTQALEHRGMMVPEDVRVDRLDEYDMQEYTNIRRRIYERRGPAETRLSQALREVFAERSKPRSRVPTEAS